jgi:hypothetical protein
MPSWLDRADVSAEQSLEDHGDAVVVVGGSDLVRSG